MPKTSRGQWIGAALGLVVLAVALWGLHKISGEVTLADVMAEVHATPLHWMVLAALSTAASYVVLIGYDWLATRHLGYRIALPTLAAASFASFTMSHTLGLTVLTGGSVRYRMYTRAEVKPFDIAAIILLCGWTFWLGIVVVAGAGMLFDPALAGPIARAVPWLKSHVPHFRDWVGAILLGGCVAYLALTAFWRKPIRIGSYRFTLPDARETLLQIVIGAVDLAFAGTALYLLLPDAGAVDWLAFLTIYAVAMVAGALSHAPGGLGVFDGIIVLFLADSSKSGVLAAVLLFRLIYTYIPFLLGLAVIGWTEFLAFRRRRAAAPAPLPPIPASPA